MDFPDSMVVLGAGVIGCEFATIFSNFGRTKVNIIDKAQQILPFEDEDISETVAANFEARGVTIHRGSTLESMDIDNGKVKYVLSYANGSKETHIVEKALVSIGRECNLRGLKLENAGLSLNERNVLAVNDTQTKQPHIYAVGDVTGEMEGRHAVEHICGLTRQPLNYDNVSTIMFLSPEVAAVGYNEKQLRAKGISYRVAKYGYRFISRALAMRNTNGFFKLIVTDDDDMRLLGVRTIGEHASSVIQASALLMAMNKGIVELAELTHPHPSITEGIQDACRMLLGTSIMKPSVFKGELRCCRVHNGETQDLWRERQPTAC
jgi:dihydrolipoamide dehydrogenase